MHIGDKVRSLRGPEEGVVTRFLSDKEVEVEIEDGFRIPFLRRDLVLVSSQEENYFGGLKNNPEDKSKKPREIISQRGLFVVFVHRNEEDLEMILVNNTDLEILFSFGEETKHGYNGVAHGLLKGRSYQKLKEVSIGNFETWPTYLVQLLMHRYGPGSLRQPVFRKLNFKAATFFNSKAEVPLLKKDAYLFQIDQELVEIDTKKILDGIMEPKPGGTPKPGIVPLPAEKSQKSREAQHKKPISREVDLHIEVLLGKEHDFRDISILDFQKKAFEEALDKALQDGIDEIVFIHGVGNGVLRKEIQRLLGQHPHVAHFKDAKKEQFGYGATAAKLK